MQSLFLTLLNFTQSRTNKLIWCVFILTYNIKELWQGLSRHEFILEGPKHALQCLVDWHVVVTDIFCQWEGPAPLCVACGNFLYGQNSGKAIGSVVFLDVCGLSQPSGVDCETYLPWTCRRPDPLGPRRVEGSDTLHIPLVLYLWVWWQQKRMKNRLILMNITC